MATQMAALSTAPANVDVLTELKTLWQECQAVERRGVHVGERLYKLRALHSAQGNHQGKGFLQLLQQAGWKERTAYYWIAKYEESIGERQPEPDDSEAAVLVPALMDALMDRKAKLDSARRMTKHIANMSAVVDAYAAEHPDAYGKPNGEILELALGKDAWNDERVAAAAAALPSETAVPATESEPPEIAEPIVELKAGTLLRIEDLDGEWRLYKTLGGGCVEEDSIACGHGCRR